jgi:protein SCO1
MAVQDRSRLFAQVAAASVAALLGLTASYVFLGRGGGDAMSQCRAGAVGGDIGGPFSLLAGDGRSVTERDVLTKPALVYFGYTFCPDICPFDNARNAEAVDILEERGIDAIPVFITVDPLRDTPEIMADYSANMHPKMVGLSGDEASIKAAAQAYKVFYQREPTEEEMYLVNHTTNTYLMMPGSGFADFFRREETAEQVADRVACFAAAAESTPVN